MGKLELYYDENRWESFKRVYDEFWYGTAKQLNLLHHLNNNLEIAKVVWGRLGKFGVEWIYAPIPALDNITPISCLEDEALFKRLKVVLMRMDTPPPGGDNW